MKKFILTLLLLVASTPLFSQANGNWLKPNAGMKNPFVLGNIQFSLLPSAAPDLFLRHTGLGTFCFGTTASDCAATMTVGAITSTTGTITTLSSASHTVTTTLTLSYLTNTSSHCTIIDSSHVVRDSVYPCDSINGITQQTPISPAVGNVPMAVSTTQWQWSSVAKLNAGNPTPNHAVCVLSVPPTTPTVVYGFCTSVVAADGSCSCT